MRTGWAFLPVIWQFPIAYPLRKHYTLWLSCTLNRNTVLLELGENYKDPSLIRWPFEKTAMLNNKAYLFRVHKIFSQVPEELSGKSCPVAEVSFKLVDDFLERV